MLKKENRKRELIYVWWRIMGKKSKISGIKKCIQGKNGNIMPDRKNNLCKGPELNQKQGLAFSTSMSTENSHTFYVVIM